MGRASVWRSERVSSFEAVSLETFTQSEYRRHDGGSRAKSEKIDQTSSWYAFFFSQIHLFEISSSPTSDFFNSLLAFAMHIYLRSGVTKFIIHEGEKQVVKEDIIYPISKLLPDA